MRIYIAGPCTGYPDLNYPAFHAEAARLRALSFEVVSPPEICAPHLDWEGCMEVCLAALPRCDVVALLPGWSHSRGALAEVRRANSLGIPCFLAEAFKE